MKALLLLSGGIDSPVAGHLMKQKGLELEALHFYNKHLSDINTVDKCKNLSKILGIKRLFLIPFDEQQAEIVNKCSHRYYYLLQRRLMWKIAEQIAKKNDCKFLITGENLAQVASQTLENLIVIEKAIDTPILRPLLTNDKLETIEESKKLGTYEISSGPEVCCLLGPKHPVTKAKLEIVEEEEAKLDFNKTIEDIETIVL